MTNVPVHPIVSWNAGVMEELKSIVLWLQYQSDIVEDVAEMKWSPVFLLDADRAKELITELQKQMITLETLT